MSITNRLRFPEDRTSFVYQGAMQPILTPPVTSVVIYADQALSTLADVVDVGGNSIANASVTTDSSGMLPEFYGPVGNIARVWAKVPGTTAAPYPLDAQLTGQLALVATILTGHGGPQTIPSTTSVALGSMYFDLDHTVLYGPFNASGWPMTGTSLIGASGPAGPAGSTLTYQQQTPVTTFTVIHSLGFQPHVTLIDTSGSEVMGDVFYPAANQVTVTTTTLFSGTALLS